MSSWRAYAKSKPQNTTANTNLLNRWHQRSVKRRPFRNVYDILEEARELRYFRNGLVVRASDDLDKPLLHMSCHEFTDNNNVIRELVSISIIHRSPNSEPKWTNLTSIRWEEDDTIQELMTKMYRGCVQANLHAEDINFDTALLNLQASWRVMVEARRQPMDSSHRLNGRLVLRINDEWVLTDDGLEAVEFSRRYPWTYDRDWDGYYFKTDRLSYPGDCDIHMWVQAEFYAEHLRFFRDWSHT